MITDNHTNRVYFSSLLPEKCPVLNAHIVDALRKRGIPFTYLKGTKDIWCRDYMPIQIEKDRFVFYRYTPDYLHPPNQSGTRLPRGIKRVASPAPYERGGRNAPYPNKSSSIP